MGAISDKYLPKHKRLKKRVEEGDKIFLLHRHKRSVQTTAKADEESAHDQALNTTKQMTGAHQCGAQYCNGIVEQ